MRLKRVAFAVLLATLLSSCAGARPAHYSGHRAHHRLFERSPSASEIAHDPAAPGELERLGMRWPLKRIEITSPYGPRGREFHEGVDLRASVGTPVYAAQAGTVLYADRKIRGYGNMVVIRHSGGITTIYAHNSRLFVRKGQKVFKGQRIAFTGKSGRAHGPHLHFEIRSGVIALNPVDMIPKAGVPTQDEIRTEKAAPKRFAELVPDDDSGH